MSVIPCEMLTIGLRSQRLQVLEAPVLILELLAFSLLLCLDVDVACL